eukprot:11190-Heterococcus_DN1.PRE.1
MTLSHLNNGASAAIANEYGVTPLHLACRSGCLQTVRHVLAASECDINATDSEGRDAVYWACDAANVELLKLLRPAASLSTVHNLAAVIHAVEQLHQAPLTT